MTHPQCCEGYVYQVCYKSSYFHAFCQQYLQELLTNMTNGTSYILPRICRDTTHAFLTPYGTETVIFWENKANIMIADALAPCVSSSSAVVPSTNFMFFQFLFQISWKSSWVLFWYFHVQIKSQFCKFHENFAAYSIHNHDNWKLENIFVLLASLCSGL